MTPSVDRGTTESDLTLVDLLEEITEKIRAGEPIDLEAYVLRYPGSAARLRELFPTLEVLVDLSKAAGRGSGSNRASEVNSRGAETLALTRGTLGDFQIRREIGCGGMGIVYEAEQISLGRRVALKILPFAAMLDPRQLQRFHNEARAAASLRHPNIVGVHAVGCQRAVHFYAMEYVEGKSLAEVIGELRSGQQVASPPHPVTLSPPHPVTLSPPHPVTLSPPHPVTLSPPHPVTPSLAPRPSPLAPEPRTLNPEPSSLAPDTERQPQAAVSTKVSTRSPEFFRSAARLAIQAAEALEHAHQMGVVHRDVKPSNLLVDHLGHLWVTDFGLAITPGTGNLTMSGDLLGTLRYMSPEQVQARHGLLDHRTDIYSLGVTLYELLALRPAFAGEDRPGLMVQIAEEEPPLPRRLNGAIPRDLETIVLKAITKEPDARYGTAQEMAEDLRRYLEDKPILARRPSLGDRAAKWARRHRAATIAAACVCLGLLTLGAGAGWYRYQEKAALERAVGESLAAARAFLQAGDYGAARQEVAEAQGRLSGANWQEGPLAAAVVSLADEVSARIRAQERFDKFRELLDSIRGSAYHMSASYRTPEQCRAALNLYHVLDDPGWQTSPEFQELDTARRTLVEQGALELLFSLGRLEVATGHSYAAADAHRRGIDALRRIEAFHRPVPAAYLWMAESWKALGEEKLGSEAAKQAAALPARTAVDYYVLGEYQADQGQYGKALESFAEALRHQPDHYPSFLRLGYCYEMLGRHELSEAMLTGAIALDPRAAIAYYRRGLARQAQQKFDAAQADFAKIVQLNQQDYVGYYAQGLLSNRKRDSAGAVAMFDKALQLNPYSFSSHLNRGVAYIRLGQDEKAEADFTWVIDVVKPQVESYPERRNWKSHLSAAYLDRALVRARQPSGHREAIDDYTAALTIDPQSASAYLGRGRCYLAEKQWDRAAADVRQAAQLAKDGEDLNGAAWFMATCPDAKLRDPQKALSLAEKAVHAAPSHHNYLNTLGVVYYRLGEHAKAIETLQKAIRTDNSGGTAWDFFFLAMAHWQLGHKDEARKWYQQAVAWMEQKKPQGEALEELLRFRAEAAELMGMTSGPPVVGREQKGASPGSPEGAGVNSQGHKPLDKEGPHDSQP